MTPSDTTTDRADLPDADPAATAPAVDTAADGGGVALRPISIDRRAQTIDTALYAFFGTMFWLGPLWLLAIVGNIFAVWATDRWGTVEQSVWAGAFAGWQMWVVGAAGIVASHHFVPTHVAFGVTRRVTAWGVALGGTFIALAGALLTTAGFAVESWWLRDRSVVAWIGDDHVNTAASVGYPTIWLAQLLVLLAAFGGGWALHAAAAAYGNVAYLAIPVWLLPVAITSFSYANRLESGPFAIDLLRLDEPLPGFVLSIVAAGACWWAASALTRRARI